MNLSQYLKSINYTKQDLSVIDPNFQTNYLPYIVMRCLSDFPDLIFIIDFLNMRKHISKKFHYRFLLDNIPKSNRYSPWKKPILEQNVELIMTRFKWSYQQSIDYLKFVSNEQIEEIKNGVGGLVTR